MYISHLDKLEKIELERPDVRGTSMKVMISSKEGWDGWVMREFTLEPSGHTPRHKHPWPHINYIIEGRGFLHVEGTDHLLRAGGVACVPPDALHQFSNAGDGPFRFVCIVPEEGHK